MPNLPCHVASRTIGCPKIPQVPLFFSRATTDQPESSNLRQSPTLNLIHPSYMISLWSHWTGYIRHALVSPSPYISPTLYNSKDTTRWSVSLVQFISWNARPSTHNPPSLLQILLLLLRAGSAQLVVAETLISTLEGACSLLRTTPDLLLPAQISG